MGQRELPLLYDRLLNPLTLLSRSVTPCGHRTLIQSKHVHNRLQRAAVCKQADDDENELGWRDVVLPTSCLSGQ
jgi:hypothetical protein